MVYSKSNITKSSGIIGNDPIINIIIDHSYANFQKVTRNALETTTTHTLSFLFVPCLTIVTILD